MHGPAGDCPDHQFIDNCCEFELPADDVRDLMLDKPQILLELRPTQDAYGVFYAAKGREWDIWCRPGDWDNPGGVAFACKEPVDAARQLLKRNWRADFGFDPNDAD
jgi:hypothetical protein